VDEGAELDGGPLTSTKRPAGGVSGHGDVLSWRDRHGLALTAAVDGTTLMYAVDTGPPTPQCDDRLTLSLDDSAPATVRVVDAGCQQFYHSHYYIISPKNNGINSEFYMKIVNKTAMTVLTTVYLKQETHP